MSIQNSSRPCFLLLLIVLLCMMAASFSLLLFALLVLVMWWVAVCVPCINLSFCVSVATLARPHGGVGRLACSARVRRASRRDAGPHRPGGPLAAPAALASVRPAAREPLQHAPPLHQPVRRLGEAHAKTILHVRFQRQTLRRGPAVLATNFFAMNNRSPERLLARALFCCWVGGCLCLTPPLPDRRPAVPRQRRPARGRPPQVQPPPARSCRGGGGGGCWGCCSDGGRSRGRRDGAGLFGRVLSRPFILFVRLFFV